MYRGKILLPKNVIDLTLKTRILTINKDVNFA